MKRAPFLILIFARFAVGCAEGEPLANDGAGGSGGTGGSGGHFIDAGADAPVDGPPCTIDAAAHSCSGPTDLGTVNIGGSMARSSNLPPQGDEDWYVVTFAANTNVMYHPHVFFTSNPGDVSRFDILSACGTGLDCMGGQTTSLTDWEVRYTGGDPASPGFAPVPAVGSAGRILIRVYRISATGPGCASYAFTVSN